MKALLTFFPRQYSGTNFQSAFCKMANGQVSPSLCWPEQRDGYLCCWQVLSISNREQKSPFAKSVLVLHMLDSGSYFALNTRVEHGEKMYRHYPYYAERKFTAHGSWAHDYNPAISTFHRVVLHHWWDHTPSLRATDGISPFPRPTVYLPNCLEAKIAFVF